MLRFVVKQHREDNHTYERNVRLGGFRTAQGAINAAIKNAPALVRDEHRNIIGQTVSGDLPNYLHAT